MIQNRNSVVILLPVGNLTSYLGFPGSFSYLKFCDEFLRVLPLEWSHVKSGPNLEFKMAAGGHLGFSFCQFGHSILFPLWISRYIPNLKFLAQTVRKLRWCKFGAFCMGSGFKTGIASLFYFRLQIWRHIWVFQGPFPIQSCNIIILWWIFEGPTSWMVPC